MDSNSIIDIKSMLDIRHSIIEDALEIKIRIIINI